MWDATLTPVLVFFWIRCWLYMLGDDLDVTLGFCWGLWQIGNPWTDSYYDNKGAVDFWFHHSLISGETYNEIQRSCDY